MYQWQNFLKICYKKLLTGIGKRQNKRLKSLVVDSVMVDRFYVFKIFPFLYYITRNSKPDRFFYKTIIEESFKILG